MKIIKEDLSFSSILFGVLLGVGTMFFVSDSLRGRSCVVDADTLSSPSTEAYIVADLGVAVRIPGVYKLNKGTRVGDLIEMGDGISNDASSKWVTKNLNLSQILNDADKVYIPFEWEIIENEPVGLSALTKPEYLNRPLSEKNAVILSSDTAEESSSSVGGLVSINTADTDELDSLPGIGPAYAQKIILGRMYKSIDDFLNRAEIPDSTKQKILNLITL